MEQLNLFNGDLEKIDEALLDKKISKIKLNYSTLLIISPCSGDEFLDIWAIFYRKMIGELLIDLDKHKKEATHFLTNWRFQKDRNLICLFAQIHHENLEIWTEQILAGAACFDKRILDDKLKSLAGIKKNAPPVDIDLIEDWKQEEINKNQLSFDW